MRLATSRSSASVGLTRLLWVAPRCDACNQRIQGYAQRPGDARHREQRGRVTCASLNLPDCFNRQASLACKGLLAEFGSQTRLPQFLRQECTSGKLRWRGGTACHADKCTSMIVPLRMQTAATTLGRVSKLALPVHNKGCAGFCRWRATGWDS
jgi:hypothetical protein